MLSRISFVFLIVACISWITYVSFDVIENEKNVDYFQLFDIENETIFSIHYNDNIDWENEKITSISENKRIIDALLKSKEAGTSVYFSSNRPLILLTKSTRWQKSEIEKIFKNGIYNLTQNGEKKYSYGQFEVIVNGNQLLVHQLKNLQYHTLSNFAVDKKSSYSKIYSKSNILYQEDVYCHKKYSKSYLKTHKKSKKILQVNDKELFANNIPENFDSYTFYTKNRLLETDSVFQNSILKDIVKSGAVLIKKNNKSLMIFDYIENKLPIQILNEKLQLLEDNTNSKPFELIRFSKLLNNKLKNSYIYQNNGIAIISNEKNLFDEVITDLSMGNILSSSQEMMVKIYSNLPHEVSERHVSNESKYAVSTTREIFMKTIIKEYEGNKSKKESKSKGYITIDPDAKIIDFEVFDEHGNLVILTENKLLGYNSNKPTWKLELQERPLSITKHKLTKFSIVEFIEKALVINEFGREEFSFPITGQQGFKVFLKENELSIALHDEEKIRFISKSRGEYHQINFVGIVEQFELIEDINKAYVISGGELVEIDLSTFETKKIQNVPNGFRIYVAKRGIILLKRTGDTISILDNSGNITGITYPNVKIHEAITANGQSCIVVSSNNKENANKVYLLNSMGQLIWSKKVPELSEISNTFTGMNNKNKSVLVLFDEIENEMVLLDFSGNSYNKEKLHAEKSVKITSFGEQGYTLTTYLKDYLIQYNK